MGNKNIFEVVDVYENLRESLIEIEDAINYLQKISYIFLKANVGCEETNELISKVNLLDDWMTNFVWDLEGFEFHAGQKCYMKLEKCKKMDESMYYFQNCILNVVDVIKSVVENYKELAIADEPMDDVERLEFAAWNSMLKESEKMVDAVHIVENELGKYFDFSFTPEI